jgi:hypothetical protein
MVNTYLCGFYLIESCNFLSRKYWMKFGWCPLTSRYKNISHTFLSLPFPISSQYFFFSNLLSSMDYIVLWLAKRYVWMKRMMMKVWKRSWRNGIALLFEGTILINWILCQQSIMSQIYLAIGHQRYQKQLLIVENYG